MISNTKFLYFVNAPENYISIFDELRYDRSDIDIISPAMRIHFIDVMKKYGFIQKTGNVLENVQNDIQCLIPKLHTLGASPFDITRDVSRREQDYLVLTPTQTACQFINRYKFDRALKMIEELIEKQPINIHKLQDYLERSRSHQEFIKAINYLSDKQNKLIRQAPLCNIRSLG